MRSWEALRSARRFKATSVASPRAQALRSTFSSFRTVGAVTGSIRTLFSVDRRSIKSVSATIRFCWASARDTLAWSTSFIVTIPNWYWSWAMRRCSLRSKTFCLATSTIFLARRVLKYPWATDQKDVVPGLGGVQETGLMALDGRHIFGRGAPEVEEQLVHGGLAAPEVPVGLGKAGPARRS